MLRAGTAYGLFKRLKEMLVAFKPLSLHLSYSLRKTNLIAIKTGTKEGMIKMRDMPKRKMTIVVHGKLVGPRGWCAFIIASSPSADIASVRS